jgi:hypothetical protein
MIERRMILPPFGGKFAFPETIMRSSFCNERATFVRCNNISRAVATAQHPVIAVSDKCADGDAQSPACKIPSFQAAKMALHG